MYLNYSCGPKFKVPTVMGSLIIRAEQWQKWCICFPVLDLWCTCRPICIIMISQLQQRPTVHIPESTDIVQRAQYAKTASTFSPHMHAESCCQNTDSWLICADASVVKAWALFAFQEVVFHVANAVHLLPGVHSPVEMISAEVSVT